MLDTTQQVPRGALVDIIIAVNYMQYSTQKGLVMEYANLPFVYRILIFIAAWLMIAGFNKLEILAYRSPMVTYAYLIALPCLFRKLLFGWTPNKESSLPAAFLQVGNYALFFVYLYGDIFGVKEQFPEDLVSYIVMVSVALSVISMMAYAAIYGIINLRHWIRRKRRARKRRF